MCKIKNGCYDIDYTFELYDFDANGDVILIKYKGCWLVVDNGYLKWSITIPPHKDSVYQAQIRFSEWIESMRKDVKCCFGILKGRWRCLKYGVHIHGLNSCYYILLTCCALHNMLLEVDGLSKQWQNGIPLYWEEEMDTRENLPFALKRLVSPGEKKFRFVINGVW